MQQILGPELTVENLACRDGANASSAGCFADLLVTQCGWARPPPTRVPIEYPFVWRKGLLNGYSSTGVSLWDSLMFGRVLEYSCRQLSFGGGSCIAVCEADELSA